MANDLAPLGKLQRYPFALDGITVVDRHIREALGKLPHLLARNLRFVEFGSQRPMS